MVQNGAKNVVFMVSSVSWKPDELCSAGGGKQQAGETINKRTSTLFKYNTTQSHRFIAALDIDFSVINKYMLTYNITYSRSLVETPRVAYSPKWL